MRKERDLDIEAYIKTYIRCSFEIDREYIMKETRSKVLEFGERKGYYKKWNIDSENVEIWIES